MLRPCTNDIDYNYHIKAIDQLQSYGVFITPHHATSCLQPRERTHTCTHTHTHTDIHGQKKPGAPGLKIKYRYEVNLLLFLFHSTFQKVTIAFLHTYHAQVAMNVCVCMHFLQWPTLQTAWICKNCLIGKRTEIQSYTLYSTVQDTKHSDGYIDCQVWLSRPC